MDANSCVRALRLIEIAPARMQVAFVVGEVETGNLQPHAMARGKMIGGDEPADLHLVDPILLQQPRLIRTVAITQSQNRVVEIEGAPIGIDIDQLQAMSASGTSTKTYSVASTSPTTDSGALRGSVL